MSNAKIDRDALIESLRRDAGDYAKFSQKIPTSHTKEWGEQNVRAWQAAEALDADTVNQYQCSQEPHQGREFYGNGSCMECGFAPETIQGGLIGEYRPTTEQIEDAYAHDPEAEWHDPINYGSEVKANRRVFRRWLADHDAEVAAKALTVPTENARERLVEFVGQQLGDAMLCTRVWDAWGVGTMTEDDFVQAGEDDGFVDDFVDALIARGFRLPVPSTPEQGDNDE